MDEIPVQLDLDGGFVVGESERAGDQDRAADVLDEEVFYDAESGVADGDNDARAHNVHVDSDNDDVERGEHSDEEIADAVDSNLLRDDGVHETNGEQFIRDTLPVKRHRPLHQPKSLLEMVSQTVATNLEKYPPEVFGAVLSEYHWNIIISTRCKVKFKRRSSVGNDNEEEEYIYPATTNKVLMPAISDKHLLQIEQHPNNLHLSRSKVADTLVWKAAVNYKFRAKGMSRPHALRVPCGVLMSQLKGWGDSLLNTMTRPQSRDEWTRDETVRRLLEERRQKEDEGLFPAKSRKRRRDDEEEELFGDDPESTDDDDSEPQLVGNGLPQAFIAYLSEQAYNRTQDMRRITSNLAESPMDVQLLSDTGIGKAVSKTIKTCSKLMKNVKKEKFEELNIPEELLGYPYFWQQQNVDAELKQWVPLEKLQQLLKEWKKMASDNGVTMSSASETPTKKAKTKRSNNEEDTGSSDTESVTYCGRAKSASIHQHLIDMKLLHASPDWRSLYQSLKKREELIRKSHGEKVRLSRESLEMNRPKIGKVVLRKAVGRVRGLGGKGTSGVIGGADAIEPANGGNSGIVGGGLSGNGVGMSIKSPAQRQSRQNEILSKSRGMKAKAKQSFSSAATSSHGRLIQIRQESKVAATWSKGSKGDVSKIAHTSSSKFSAFGASVAFAGGSSGSKRSAKGGFIASSKAVGKQVQVKLSNGKQMTLPSSSLAGAGKSVGVFSSLQKKKAAVKKSDSKRDRSMR
eukprot:scaffold132_cov189-Alexandrium_tamarense.AAC.1